MNIPLVKIDEEKRMVYGRATQEIIDKSGEILDYETSKPEFEKWSNDFATRTAGKSYGNVRAQHDSTRVVGKIAEPLHFNDKEKAIDVAVKVTDDGLFRQIKDGVYTGFSVGGRYGKVWNDESGYRHYTAVPAELSIVDNPCVGSATIDYVKADGTVVKKEIGGRQNTLDDNKIVEELTKALKDEKFVSSLAKMFAELHKSDNGNKGKEPAKTDPKAEPKADPKDGGKDDGNKEPVKKSDGGDTGDPSTKSDDGNLEDCFTACVKAIDNSEDAVKDDVRDGCQKVFHKMVQHGLLCTCDKCTAALKSAYEKAEKATHAGMNKAAENAMQGEALSKLTASVGELQKTLDAVKEENKSLHDEVEKLAKQPMPGGAIVQKGTGATVVQHNNADDAATELLQKMFEQETDPIVKQKLSEKLTKASMMKVFG